MATSGALKQQGEHQGRDSGQPGEGWQTYILNKVARICFIKVTFEQRPK